jgi:hypothetical protein
VAATDLPTALRRAASRPALIGRPPEPGTRLADAARSGVLTRSNTWPGTQGRQAVDAEGYRRRQAKRRQGVRARAMAGHRPLDGTADFYSRTPEGAALVRLEGLTAGEVRRAARYMYATAVLLDDLRSLPWDADATRRAFRRRFERWTPIGGLRVVSDPDAVVALAEHARIAEEEPIFDSGRRPGRTRR